MTNATCSNICKILTNSYGAMDCDFRFVLRNILSRAAEEANYLSFQFEDVDSGEFRQAKIYLEGIVLDLPDMLDDRGDVFAHCRLTISKAVTLARYLIAIEQHQTVGQLDMLERTLKEHSCCDCQGMFGLN